LLARDIIAERSTDSAKSINIPKDSSDVKGDDKNEKMKKRKEISV